MLKLNSPSRVSEPCGATEITSSLLRGRFLARAFWNTLGTLVLTGVLLGLGLTLWPGWQRAHSTAKTLSPALQGQAALDQLKKQGQYDSLTQAIEATRYSVKQTLRAGEYAAANPAQGYHTTFKPTGVELAAPGGGDWRLAMSLRAVGYGKQLQPASEAALNANSTRVELRRTLAPQSTIRNPQSAIKEWYENRSTGLEQGFTLEAVPGERQAGEQLELALAVGAGWHTEVQADGQAAAFVHAASGTRLQYDHLTVTDATGRQLAARMETVGEELRMVVEDATAQYPVTIDPTITQQAYLKPAAVGTTQAGDQFGVTVAVSGDTVVVGAPLEDSSTTGVNSTANEGATNAGAAYVFTRNAGVWTQQAYLKPAAVGTTQAGDQFGCSVAVSGDTVVVGALFEDSSSTGVNSTANEGATNAGAAYVFTRSAGVWTQQAYLKPAAVGTTQAGDLFGCSVAVTGDTVIVGALFEDSSTTGVNSTPDESAADSGSAYVFTRSAGVWTQQAYLKPAAVGTTQAGDQFGYSVGVSGDTMVVGARLEASSTLGVNSTPNESAADSGAAYVFTRSAGVWTQQAYLKPAAVGTTQAGDQFGWSVAVSGDTVIVGALFEASSTTGVNSTPNESAAESGAAYVFTRSAGVWTQQAYLKPAAVGTTQAGDQFGFTVVVSGDTVVVGAPNENSGKVGINTTPDESAADSGAAYIFTRSAGVWTQQAYLKPAAVGTTQLGDQFGYSVAVSGDWVVVGANGEDSSTTSINSTPNESSLNSGAVYVFTAPAATAPEIAVSEIGVGNIVDGGSFSFGTTTAGAPVTKTFTVTNSGTANLTLSNLTLPSGFGIAANFGNTTVTPGNSTTFQITMAADAVGTPSGSLSFDNNDADENPFNFTIGGTVTGTAPMINCPGSIVTTTDPGQCMAAVTFLATATGAPAPTVTCTPASGFAFPVGTTTVSCTASNGVAPDATCTFTVTVNDGQAPTLGACPTNITNQSAGANCTAAVIFTPPTASDNCGTATVTCTPASGSDFPLGTTTVSCVAKDTANNMSSACTFTVQVVDTTAPTLGACPSNITNQSADANCMAVVNFTPPMATDNCGTPIVTCTPASGTSFAIGTTTVTCSATDAANNMSAPCSFTVTVTASAPPVLSYSSPQMTVPGQSLMINPLTGPSDDGSISSIVVQSVTPSTAPGTITVDSMGVVTAPGNVPVGSYTVTIRATDNCGSFTDASFTLNVSCVAITVTPQSLPNGFVGTPYTQALGAMGGTSPYGFALDSGAFPPGLNIVGTNLMGTPTATGVFNFTIKATDSGGCFGTRAYTVVISGTGLQFYPLAHPIRLVDTRVSASACQTPGMPVDPGNALTVPARGVCGGLTIPANAAAVTGNVTTVGPAANGFLTIYSSSAAQPQASNSNYQLGQTLNNVFTVGLGAADGAFKIFSAQKTDVIVDITGYFAPPGTGGLFFHPLPAPVRLLDTRAGQAACTMPGTPIPADTEVLQQGNAICGIPASAVALVGNAITVGPAAQGFLTLFPANETRPLIASGNYQTGQTLNSPFTAGLSPSGNFTIYSFRQTDLVVDVLGYYSADASDAIGIGLLFSPMTPARLLDTRLSQPACFTPGAAIPATTETPQAAGGTCTIPATAKAIVGNATTVSPAAQGFLTFWPSDATRPNAATSNFAAGVNFNRHFTVGLGSDGAFKMYALTSTHLVVDVSGSFAP